MPFGNPALPLLEKLLLSLEQRLLFARVTARFEPKLKSPRLAFQAFQ